MRRSYYTVMALLAVVQSSHSFQTRTKPSRSATVLLRSTSQDDLVNVALTRESDKNDKLLKSLKSVNGVSAIELPCIAHADGSEYDQLASALTLDWDYVACTSPEAARVLASAWDPQHVHKVAAVGKATEQSLKENGIPVAFCPSKATAETLVQELPTPESSSSSNGRVLYPASQRARKTLEQGLQARGFHVTRLNTYDTVTAEWNDEQRKVSETCRIVCFASPSAIKGWLHNTQQRTNLVAACIGETSAQACRELGWKEDTIFYPEQPGVDGWVQAVEDAMKSLTLTHS